MNKEERFLEKVEKTDTCWIWKGYITIYGYGYISFRSGKNRKRYYAHRLSYILNKGKIPKNFQIDHLCRNTKCVNPSHLEAVTATENNARSFSTSARNTRKTHCLRGHPFSGKNLHVYSNGHRRCKTCHRNNKLKLYHLNKKGPVGPCGVTSSSATVPTR